ncbi:3-oxoacyl-ACP reductase FabG [Streptomyces sp. AK02-01A]|uniref:3-oxoacyl-ACP reductase FabG n=1 Tax=Streptomyces sp. AK02-01A TaxID=3028648 RepID=UPI0029AA0DEC|nr:3-oxoacyl-ACP reductase FabG [Streptomyces sp. AK02-01A]MDX3854869.1 3-oxoacyl-ACP reductase FabG [Streptomyces sp. AK02-01A]
MSRSILVTGGNRGIGLAIAHSLAAAGDRVAITYRSGEPPQGFLAVRCDVRDPGQIESAYEEIEAKNGQVQVLVANAGITKDMPLVRMSEEDFTSVLDVNLTGTFRVVRRVVGGMLSARDGRIVLISSVVGLHGASGLANYAASKAALLGFARSVAREAGPHGITCNAVAPGYVDTDMMSKISPAQREKLLAQVPLGRSAHPQEIAAVVRFLASKGAAYINGAVVPVDGGMGMGH